MKSSCACSSLLLWLLIYHHLLHTTDSFSTTNNNNNNNLPDPPSNNNNDPNDNKKHKTQQAQAQSAEAQRRKLRQSTFAIPGTTSAIPGATDLPLNIPQTEQEWNSYATPVEQAVKTHTARGMEYLRLLNLDFARQEFQQVYQLKPDAYCWQYGVVLFYLDQVQEAAACFAHNAAIYESKFGMVASEERIWRDACQLKLQSSMNKRDWNTFINSPEYMELAQNPQMSEEVQSTLETRKVLRLSRMLFESSVQEDYSTTILSRSHLRSICGEYINTNNGSSHPYSSSSTLNTSSSSSSSSIRQKADFKMWRLNSWYYLGLHYDVIGKEEKSKECMKMALRQCLSTAGNANDIIHTLPMLHMSKRDWYDDDDFEEDFQDFSISTTSSTTTDNNQIIQPSSSHSSSSTTSTTINNNNSNNNKNNNNNNNNNNKQIQIKSIQESVQALKLDSIKSCLKKRGLRTSGASKAELRSRLLSSLLEGEGLQ